MARKPKDESVDLPSATVKEITRVAAQAACETYRREAEKEAKKAEAERRRAEEERKDRRLHNTRLLMEKYRALKAYSEGAIYDASQIEGDMEFQELVELMGSRNMNVDLTVESIRRDAAQTRIILKHVDTMLALYKLSCQSSQRQDLIRRWDVVQGLYIQDEPCSMHDLADRHGVDVKTIQRDKKDALDKLSALFFGIF